MGLETEIVKLEGELAVINNQMSYFLDQIASLQPRRKDLIEKIEAFERLLTEVRKR